MKEWTTLYYLERRAEADYYKAEADFVEATIGGVDGDWPDRKRRRRRNTAAKRALDASRRCVELGLNIPKTKEFLDAYLKNQHGR